jgi:hypothetical protein
VGAGREGVGRESGLKFFGSGGITCTRVIKDSAVLPQFQANFLQFKFFSGKGPMFQPVEIMATCTIRIEGTVGGVSHSVGTAFLFAVPLEEPHRFLPALITNKHVLEGCDGVTFRVSVSSIAIPAEETGRPAAITHRTVNARIASKAEHPGPVDLCGVNVGFLTNILESEGLRLHHAYLSQDMLLDTNTRSYMRAAEPVVMVGYPQGIWDSVNNAPVIRRGITATHPFVAYEGRNEFLIDAACFPGSSGSPVFLFEDGWYRSGPDSATPGTRIGLLGVLYAGPQMNREGRLVPAPIPHGVLPVPVTSIPINLGYVINADEIDALVKVMIAHYRGRS